VKHLTIAEANFLPSLIKDSKVTISTARIEKIHEVLMQLKDLKDARVQKGRENEVHRAHDIHIRSSFRPDIMTEGSIRRRMRINFSRSPNLEQDWDVPSRHSLSWSKGPLRTARTPYHGQKQRLLPLTRIS